MGKSGRRQATVWRRRVRVIAVVGLLLACALLGSCSDLFGDNGGDSGSTGSIVWDQTDWDAASWG